MQIISVPVVFWGHAFTGNSYLDKFQIKYNPQTEGWGYTVQSAFCGDSPYCDWIDEKFKPNYKKKAENVQHIMIVRELVIENGVPKYMKFGLQRKFKFPEELQKRLNEWKYWEGTPEPDTSAYYQDIDLDNEDWQCEDAEIKTKGNN